MITLYLDTCCLNRPFDEPWQLRVRAEASAVMEILQGVAQGDYQLVSSDILCWEIDKHPDPHKKSELFKMLTLASRLTEFHPDMGARAEFLTTLGFRAFDALHVAAAEQAAVNCFLTTDDKLLKLAARHSGVLKTSVMNPVQWIWTQMI